MRFQGTPLVVGRPRQMIVLGVGEDVGRVVFPGEVELVCLKHDWRHWWMGEHLESPRRVVRSLRWTGDR